MCIYFQQYYHSMFLFRPWPLSSCTTLQRDDTSRMFTCSPRKWVRIKTLTLTCNTNVQSIHAALCSFSVCHVSFESTCVTELHSGVVVALLPHSKRDPGECQWLSICPPCDCWATEGGLAVTNNGSMIS